MAVAINKNWLQNWVSFASSVLLIPIVYHLTFEVSIRTRVFLPFLCWLAPWRVLKVNLFIYCKNNTLFLTRSQAAELRVSVGEKENKRAAGAGKIFLVRGLSPERGSGAEWRWVAGMRGPTESEKQIHGTQRCGKERAGGRTCRASGEGWEAEDAAGGRWGIEKRGSGIQREKTVVKLGAWWRAQP